MNTATTQIIYNDRDDVLIYEVGSTTQDKNPEYSNGVTGYRFKKTLAAFLRHWEILRGTVPGCGSISLWGIQHAPFRHGQVIYRPMDSGATVPRNEYGVLFIEDIISRSVILRSLGVRIETKDKFEDRRKRILFPRADALVYGNYQKATGFGQPDLEILKSLAVYYSQLGNPIIESLSTCPTKQDCLRAMSAEFCIWAHDIERILRLLKPSKADYSVMTASEDINDALKLAFNCGSQVGEKLNWYESLPNIRQEMVKAAVALNNLRLVTPVLNILESGEITEDLSTIKDLAKILTGFVGLMEMHLQRLYPRIALPPKDSERARRYISQLRDVGLTPYVLTDLETLTGRKEAGVMPIAVEMLEKYYREYIIPFLKDRNVPWSYERIKLFP